MFNDFRSKNNFNSKKNGNFSLNILNIKHKKQRELKWKSDIEIQFRKKTQSIRILINDTSDCLASDNFFYKIKGNFNYKSYYK